MPHTRQSWPGQTLLQPGGDRRAELEILVVDRVDQPTREGRSGADAVAERAQPAHFQRRRRSRHRRDDEAPVDRLTRARFGGRRLVQADLLAFPRIDRFGDGLVLVDVARVPGLADRDDDPVDQIIDDEVCMIWIACYDDIFSLLLKIFTF